MLYYLFTYLKTHYEIPGGGLFHFITFRAAMAFILSIIISLVFGKRLIMMLQRMQVGEDIRDLGLAGQLQKQGTPTMGGFIILGGVLIPTLLFAQIGSVYIWLILVSTVFLGMIGFVDDYIKVFKHNKKGLAGKFKLLGQVFIGLFVGAVLYFHPDVVLRETVTQQEVNEDRRTIHDPEILQKGKKDGETYFVVDHKSAKTTIPFVKDNEFDYAQLITWIDVAYEKYAYLVYIPIVIFIITAVSNGANITDGLDGLAAGVSAIIVFTLAIFAYVSGHSLIAGYLNIMYIPDLGELVIFAAALIGGCVGFLWFNAYPAQVFMGDTGSLSLGGLIAVLAIMVRKELLIPLLCGVFLIENLSVMVQVSYFKYTKKKYGEGRRILKMSPLHHHYQKVGFHEAKIVSRFWIVSVFLAILTIITLKIR
ncbi:MAG: phospho-N-acetylmuramoyl-pentapeptide-transferase [Bacteroidota bacterium]|nr:phospho-N-acetylmuramoyl-pentapeptide-transferase [Bacteroidota bacterium]